jgi:hypothetical protein
VNTDTNGAVGLALVEIAHPPFETEAALSAAAAPVPLDPPFAPPPVPDS